MSEAIRDLGHGFWTIRGDLKIGGLLNVGTQAGLVQLASGRFVVLDSYPLRGQVRDRVMALTDGGRAVEAVLNLHPFHTLHCAATARDFPQARLYGTRRHWHQHRDLPWQAEPVDSDDVRAMFASDLHLTVPDGIDLACPNERVHAGSVLAWHRRSGTLHVDDTINVMPVPRLLRRLVRNPRIFLHPTMPQALLPRPDAPELFGRWVHHLAAQCSGLRWLCAAHSGLREFPAGQFATELAAAFRRMEPRLARAAAARA
ncbi:MAG: hypothetical protein FJX25_06830 [Alphaproteobacteria bacterium]|nr:hypothetical protein [Alphaproteobacteria bacterium]